MYSSQGFHELSQGFQPRRPLRLKIAPHTKEVRLTWAKVVCQWEGSTKARLGLKPLPQNMQAPAMSTSLDFHELSQGFIPGGGSLTRRDTIQPFIRPDLKDNFMIYAKKRMTIVT